MFLFVLCGELFYRRGDRAGLMWRSRHARLFQSLEVVPWGTVCSIGKNHHREDSLTIFLFVSLNMHYVYILRSKKDEKYYYGSTIDLQKRLHYHNTGKVRSTKNRRPLEICYYELCKTKREAIKREGFFKSISGYNWLRKNKII